MRSDGRVCFFTSQDIDLVVDVNGYYPSSATFVSVVPNPFNPSSTVHFRLARRERVKISVFDVAGRSVRELADRDEDAGAHTVWWDGADDRGATVASGVYFVKFSAGSVSRTMKMVLVK